jgi:hypothetical protein
MGCEIKQKNVPSESVDELKKFLNLASDTVSARWQLMTLPEGNEDGVPGRTDYVVLLAWIQPGLGERELSLLPSIASTHPVQKHFVKDWLPLGVQRLLSDLPEQKGLLDAKSLVRRPNKRAIGAGVDGGFFVYVEYVSP